MDIEKIKLGINKTGFVHEYKVCEILEQNKWNVINNRYYLDDVQEINREIDIIAYRVNEVEDILYYTSLIISCKKSESNIWSFLTKDIKNGDPNINFCPISNWANDKVLSYMIKPEKVEDEVWSVTSDHEELNFVYGINDHVFAFQQLNKTSYTPQNDKDIYNSIISSIKALEYEKNSLDERKNRKVMYNFNLISIFDGEMIKVHLNNEGESIEEIDEIKYLNRHIVNKNENFYRVHFIKFSRLQDYITNFNKLHHWNCEFYPNLRRDFFNNITIEEPKEKIDLLLPEFIKEVLWYVSMEVEDFTIDKLNLKFNTYTNLMEIGFTGENLTFNEENHIAEVLDNSDTAKRTIKEGFNKVYNFNGFFSVKPYYEVDLPF
ncbi:hypothetical protein [Bacillus sp. Marseille-Q1617]|uniref:hypothetical protein n=1 Tax=Bacillus sp. Marseille-Q1617 TaxID=2736887 RepID=UPI00158C1711|nr:hypothetical protein [Bacillus sp. Marseille-Q1617]